MLIEDGQGTGLRAGVDASNRLKTLAITESLLEQLNEDRGAVWAIPLDAVAPSGATKFFYMTNNGLTEMNVVGFHFAASVAGVYRVTKVTGTPAGGTAVTASPLNLGSVTPVPAAAQTGASITGLTDSGVLYLATLQVGIMFMVEFPSRIYLPPGTSMAIQAPGAATVNGCVTVSSET